MNARLARKLVFEAPHASQPPTLTPSPRPRFKGYFPTCPNRNSRHCITLQDSNAPKPSEDAPAVGTKRKADPEEDARTAAGEAAKKHRADAAALLQAPCGAAAAAADGDAAGVAPRESFHLACRFFDEAGIGYLDEKDLEDIVHCSQPYTSRRWVRSVVESVCRRGRLRYADLPDIPVVYHPPQPPPVGAEVGDAAAAGGSSVQVDGVMVDVPALRAAAAASSAALQDASGARARAEVRPRHTLVCLLSAAAPRGVVRCQD